MFKLITVLELATGTTTETYYTETYAEAEAMRLNIKQINAEFNQGSTLTARILPA